METNTTGTSCLAPSMVTDSLLIERQRNEVRYIHEVVSEQAIRTALIAWQIEPPVGRAALEHVIAAAVAVRTCAGTP